MENVKNAPQAPGLVQCAKNPEKTWEIAPQDRVFLLLTLGFCLLMVDSVLFHQPGLGITLLVFCWHGLSLAYGGRGLLRTRESRVLLGADLFLALTFALTSNWWFRLWDLGALLVLTPLQALSAQGTLPWWRPAMLRERLALLLRGLLGSLGAAPAALRRRDGQGGGRVAAVLAGTAVSLGLLAVLLPVLADADALFAAVTLDFMTFFRDHFTTGLWKLCLSLAATPFVFGFLYRLGRPEPLNKLPADRSGDRDGLGYALVLGSLCGLYLLFLAVQLRGLAGGAAYLAEKGISYAEWARSGFFQMVGVTAVNLAAALTALTRSRRTGRCWRLVRGLSVLLAAESLALLASACCRMTLYVSVYGLSFKRLMTYWGMGMMAVFLALALWKSLRPDFRFCRAAFPAALAGWLAVNCVPADYLVAKDQVDRYLSGQSAAMDVEYLAFSLSFDALGQLERLDPAMGSGRWVPELTEDVGYTLREETVGEILANRRQDAARACGQWESWNLSARLAAGGTGSPG